MRGERLEVATAEVAAAARVIALLGPDLDLSGQSVSGVRGAASGTEAEGADALANATARAAECYQLADQYAMADPAAGG